MKFVVLSLEFEVGRSNSFLVPFFLEFGSAANPCAKGDRTAPCLFNFAVTAAFTATLDLLRFLIWSGERWWNMMNTMPARIRAGRHHSMCLVEGGRTGWGAPRSRARMFEHSADYDLWASALCGESSELVMERLASILGPENCFRLVAKKDSGRMKSLPPTSMASWGYENM